MNKSVFNTAGYFAFKQTRFLTDQGVERAVG